MRRNSVIVLVAVFSVTIMLSLPQVYAEVVSLTVDLQTILLEPGQVIPLLDTKSVGNLTTLQVSATLPCDGSHVPKLKIIAGSLGNLTGVIDSSSDYGGLTGPFSTCYFSDAIAPESNLPAINKVFLKNDGSSSIVTNLGSIITLTGNVTNDNTAGSGLSTIYSTDFSSSSGWTQVGTTVNVTGGVLQRSGSTTDDREYHNIGQTISDNYWKVEYKWVTDEYVNTGWSEKVMILSAGNSAQKTANNQDAIFIYSDNGAYMNRQYLCYQDGTTQDCVTYPDNTISITGGTVYPRIERTSQTEVIYQVFSDSSRTTLIDSTTLSIPNTVTGLNTIMSQSDGGSHHYDIDDLTLQQ